MATTREERRRAKRAIEAARTMETEVRRMAKRLPKGARARMRLESAVRFAEASVQAAATERRRTPRLAALRAERAAAWLDRASIRFGPAAAKQAGTATGRSARRERRDGRRIVGADAAVRAKARADLAKRRRKQSDQVQKMAKRVALLTVHEAIVAPTDAERAKDLRKQVDRDIRKQERGARPGR
ncbi:hypothetical protein GE115_07675 [Agromyces sp. CFH 90414]|uniref:Uncharacterized protein n=1 Tax=Agromyces agglutinans TaxID=2662258 RepID=A0A6I2F2K9_9MICO|nr:hypothetical protein [Agromyces agglutinans]MRG59745.1 hypothetical protein [Agromyces agglutinans]